MGCNHRNHREELFLDELLAFWREHCDTTRRKEESSSTKKRLKMLHARLTKLICEIEQARTTPLHILSRKSLAQALPHQSSFDREAKNLQDDADKIERLATISSLPGMWRSKWARNSMTCGLRMVPETIGSRNSTTSLPPWPTASSN